MPPPPHHMRTCNVSPQQAGEGADGGGGGGVAFPVPDFLTSSCPSLTSLFPSFLRSFQRAPEIKADPSFKMDRNGGDGGGGGGGGDGGVFS